MTDSIDPPMIAGVHHAAFRCFDAEETRAFYEDVLGLELAAALTFDTAPGTDQKLRYMHLFFRMGEGDFVAFFDLPDHLARQSFKPRSGFSRHIAFRVPDAGAVDAYRARLEAAGLETQGPIDHDFVYSVYTYDPNGIQVEITCPTPDHDRILKREQAEAREILKAWTRETAEAKASAGER